MIGVFGGTFDPIHQGHLALIRQAFACLPLAELRLLPCYLPVHKAGPHATAEHRLALIECSLTSLPESIQDKIIVDPHEINSQQARYTVDSLQELRNQLDDKQPLVFLMGADSLLNLTSWHRWQGLAEIAHLAVFSRPGFDLDRLPQPLHQWLDQRLVPMKQLSMTAYGSVALDQHLAVEISSSELRADPDLLLMEVPNAARDYIIQHNLYGVAANKVTRPGNE